MNANKPATKPTWNDPDDAPELSDAWFAQADLYRGDKLLRTPKAMLAKHCANLGVCLRHALRVI
jgi:hypothetical protein